MLSSCYKLYEGKLVVRLFIKTLYSNSTPDMKDYCILHSKFNCLLAKFTLVQSCSVQIVIIMIFITCHN